MQKILLVVLVAIIFVLVGCESIDAAKLETHSQYSNAEVFTDNPLLFLSFITETLNGTNYTITSSLFEAEKDMRISFPEVGNLDGELQEKVNRLIWGEVHQMLSIFPEREDLTLDITYEIKFSSDRLLSIAYTGMGFVQGSTRPTHLFYTLNINMETGEKIVLNDVVRINEMFVALLLSDSTIHLNPYPELKQFVRGIIAEDTFLYRLQSADNPMFYFTGDSLGISISGLGGAAGDHTELEIQYKAIFSHLKDS